MGTAGPASASATSASAASASAATASAATTARAVRGCEQLVHEQPEYEQLVREQFGLPERRHHCSVGWRFVQAGNCFETHAVQDAWADQPETRLP